MINPSQRPLTHNTQHSQERDIHAPAGILTHYLRRREASDLRLRPRGHWDRLKPTSANCNVLVTEQYGFRKETTKHAALDLKQDYLYLLKQKIKSACVFCDLAKTFKCIMKFCYLITFYGVRGLSED